jgi:hypothetical protein
LRRINGREGFQGGLKLVKNHLGKWDVYVESPRECRGLECTIRQLDPGACSVYQAEVRNTGTVLNDIRVREGQATFECKFASGGSFSAKLKFDGCS